jgi:rifampin ADP-ribosylating transferase
MPATAAAAPGEPVFYHGTNTALAPGTRLTPDDAISFSPGGAASNAVTQGRAPHVFLTTDYKHADMYARVRAQTHGGEPHVYEVRPTGAYDPNPADERFREGLPPMSFRSVHPVTVGGEITEPPKRRKRARAVAAPVASKELAMTRPGAADISRIGSWLPENIGEVQEMLDDFPLLFIALADGLTSLAARIEGPVDERIPGALATMAAACQSAAEDARDTAVRAHETAGAWHG